MQLTTRGLEEGCRSEGCELKKKRIDGSTPPPTDRSALHNRAPGPSHKTRTRKEALTHPPPHATNQIVNKLFQIKLSQSTSSIDLLFKTSPSSISSSFLSFEPSSPPTRPAHVIPVRAFNERLPPKRSVSRKSSEQQPNVEEEIVDADLAVRRALPDCGNY